MLSVGRLPVHARGIAPLPEVRVFRTSMRHELARWLLLSRFLAARGKVHGGAIFKRGIDFALYLFQFARKAHGQRAAGGPRVIRAGEAVAALLAVVEIARLAAPVNEDGALRPVLVGSVKAELYRVLFLIIGNLQASRTANARHLRRDTIGRLRRRKGSGAGRSEQGGKEHARGRDEAERVCFHKPINTGWLRRQAGARNKL